MSRKFKGYDLQAIKKEQTQIKQKQHRQVLLERLKQSKHTHQQY